MNDLLHKIDKRLAVMEALTKEHNQNTQEQFAEIHEDLEKVRAQLDKLKIRVAGISGGISLFIGAMLKWLL